MTRHVSMKARRPRHCTKCGKPYHRVNKVDIWTVRNEGHRLGWQKTLERLCNNCCNEGQARKTAVLFGVRMMPVNRKSDAKVVQMRKAS